MTRLATIRYQGGTRAVRLEGYAAVVLTAPDVRAVLASGVAEPTSTVLAAAELDYAPVIPAPDKILCAGLNYTSHLAETTAGKEEHPTLFSKFASALVGAYDDIVLPYESDLCDWEAELCVVIGHPARRVSREEAGAYIAGYTIMNDVSVRDWQTRTSQWLQGKSWERTTPLGPWLDTSMGGMGTVARRISCEVDEVTKQDGNTRDMLFSPADLVAYASTFCTLLPGDLIATGTPSGVGMASGQMLRDGNVLTTRIEGLGECRNTCRGEAEGRQEGPVLISST